ncbi:hypothetical protein WA026_000893 [Henosepilachna vigintioctopunctata]|uniref:Uncharacterized protein n=1 Tax=Henosepilachna vigintioctopunctata TaxID=420089 RepID=A0AAW1V9E9_9CUCU
MKVKKLKFYHSYSTNSISASRNHRSPPVNHFSPLVRMRGKASAATRLEFRRLTADGPPKVGGQAPMTQDRVQFSVHRELPGLDRHAAGN